MHPVRKKRLAFVTLIVLGSSIGVGLMLYALSNNMNLFFSPIKIQNGEAPVERTIRLGGMVVENSIERIPNSLKVRFTLTDYKAEVPVIYEGILPDLFAEGEGAVATGELDASGTFNASQILAKHDENYMPPELSKALEPEKSVVQ